MMVDIHLVTCCANRTEPLLMLFGTLLSYCDQQEGLLNVVYIYITFYNLMVLKML